MLTNIHDILAKHTIRNIKQNVLLLSDTRCMLLHNLVKKCW